MSHVMLPGFPRTAHRQHRKTVPAWLCIVALGLCAWCYMTQSDRASAAGAQVRQQQQITQQLMQQRQAALARLAAVQSPAYVIAHAPSLGMVLGSWGDAP
jgi:uncharacterized membrane protein